MTVTAISILDAKTYQMELDITPEQLNRIRHRRENGEYVQDIVPHLSPEEREFLISGITPEKWKETFA